MVLIALGMLLLLLLYRAENIDTSIVKAWLGVWGISAVGAIVFENHPWWQLSILTGCLFWLTLMLGLGAYIGGGQAGASSPNTGAHTTQHEQVRLHFLTTLLCLLPAYASIHLLLNDLGQGYSSFTDLDSFVAAAAAASVARYEDEFTPALVTRLLSTFIFVSALLSGWYFSRPDVRFRWPLAVAAFVPALGWTLLLTTKANILFWLTLFAAAFLSFKPRSNRNNKKQIFIAAAGLVVVGVVLYLVQVSRYGGDISEVADQASEAIGVAAVGHMFALRSWLDGSDFWLPATFGSRSIAGVFELLGITERQLGVFGEENVDVGNSFTNVYSVVRQLAEDFGLPLTSLLFCFIGYGSAKLGRSATKILTQRAIHAALLAWIIFSPISSIFNYNSLILACGFAVLLALAFDLKEARRANAAVAGMTHRAPRAEKPTPA